MNSCESAYSSVLKRIAAASAAAGLPRPARLLAVGKTKPAAALRALAALGQTAFGENYVQEALGKQAALADLRARMARDRAAAVEQVPRRRAPFRLAADARPRQARRSSRAAPTRSAVAAERADPGQHRRRSRQVRLRARRRRRARRAHRRTAGAAPSRTHGDSGTAARPVAPARRVRAHARAVRSRSPATTRRIDTLSMGMSDDFELAIAEGATMVRIGSALFGARSRDSGFRNRGVASERRALAEASSVRGLLCLHVDHAPRATMPPHSRIPNPESRLRRLHRRRQHGAQPDRRADPQRRERAFDRRCRTRSRPARCARARFRRRRACRQRRADPRRRYDRARGQAAGHARCLRRHRRRARRCAPADRLDRGRHPHSIRSRHGSATRCRSCARCRTRRP